MAVKPDDLAMEELEHHRVHLRYADRQRAKAGEYEAVARSLQRRSYIRLVVGAVVALALLWAGKMGLYLAIVLLVTCALDYSHTKRTRASIIRLLQEDQRRHVEEAP